VLVDSRQKQEYVTDNRGFSTGGYVEVNTPMGAWSRQLVVVGYKAAESAVKMRRSKTYAALPIEAVAADPDHCSTCRKVCKQSGPIRGRRIIDVDLVLRRGEWLSIPARPLGEITLLNILGCLDRNPAKYLFDGIETTTLARMSGPDYAGAVGFISSHFISCRIVPCGERHAGGVYRRHTGRGRRERRWRKFAASASRIVRIFRLPNCQAGTSAGGDRPCLDGLTEFAAVRRADRQPDSKTRSILDFFTSSTGRNDDCHRHARRNVARRGSRRGQHGRMATLWRKRARITSFIQGGIAASGITAPDLCRGRRRGDRAAARMALTGAWHRHRHVALVATIGLTRTAGNRIISSSINSQPRNCFICGAAGNATGTIDPRAIPWDAPGTARRLNGVVAAGYCERRQCPRHAFSAYRVIGQSDSIQAGGARAFAGLFRAVRAELASGRFLDSGILPAPTASRSRPR